MTTFAFVTKNKVVAVVESNPIFDVRGSFNQKLEGNEVLEVEGVVPKIGDTVKGDSGKVSEVVTESKDSGFISVSVLLSRCTTKELLMLEDPDEDEVKALAYLLENSTEIDIRSDPVVKGLAVLEAEKSTSTSKKDEDDD